MIEDYINYLINNDDSTVNDSDRIDNNNFIYHARDMVNDLTKQIIIVSHLNDYDKILLVSFAYNKISNIEKLYEKFSNHGKMFYTGYKGNFSEIKDLIKLIPFHITNDAKYIMLFYGVSYQKDIELFGLIHQYLNMNKYLDYWEFHSLSINKFICNNNHNAIKYLINLAPIKISKYHLIVLMALHHNKQDIVNKYLPFFDKGDWYYMLMYCITNDYFTMQECVEKIKIAPSIDNYLNNIYLKRCVFTAIKYNNYELLISINKIVDDKSFWLCLQSLKLKGKY